MYERLTKPDPKPACWLSRLLIQGCLVLLLAQGRTLQAGAISVPNASFEAPTILFSVSTVFDSWQRMPQPAWWDENVTGPWTNLTGIFKNPVLGSSDHIDNCHGNQAAWLFANPDAGLFQDYDSMDWNDSSPTHAFDTKFEVGKSYRLQVGLIVGTGAGLPMQEGVTLNLSLYFRDTASNRIAVATTIVTNSSTVFSNGNHFLDFEVNTPVVKAGNIWAGQNIGIQLLSTVSSELAGGYWDLDNVRLSSILSPTFVNPTHTNGQFQFTIQSEPGLAFEMFASTNLSLPPQSWTSLGIVTNFTGAIPFVDTSSNFPQRFYQARQLP